MKPRKPFAFIAGAIALVLAPGASAQSSTPINNVGTIEGRVVDAGRGDYVEGARIVVEGTTLETFTEADGSFRLSNVPAGLAQLKVFFTGLAPRSDSIAVSAGQTVRHESRSRLAESPPASPVPATSWRWIRCSSRRRAR